MIHEISFNSSLHAVLLYVIPYRSKDLTSAIGLSTGIVSKKLQYLLKNKRECVILSNASGAEFVRMRVGCSQHPMRACGASTRTSPGGFFVPIRELHMWNFWACLSIFTLQKNPCPRLFSVSARLISSGNQTISHEKLRTQKTYAFPVSPLVKHK